MKRFLLPLFCFLSIIQLEAQEIPVSEKVAASIMNTWPDSIMSLTWKRAHFTYTTGLVLKGIQDEWMRTGNKIYYDYLVKNIDFFLQKDGSIKTYNINNYDLNALPPGRNLLLLFQVTAEEKYLDALKLLRNQIQAQPRTHEGGFCHSSEYKYQMWLDGIYMSLPFYTEYAKLFHENQDFDDIANQFIWIEKHTRDSKTGLLYHAWDESKVEKWADKNTGCSANFWGRAMGWYGMALVDVIDVFPLDHPKRKELLDILNRFVTAILKVQDQASGLWYQVLDKADMKGNYLEASASTMFTYTLIKGVRKGMLDEKYFKPAKVAYESILKNFVTVDAKGFTHLNRICLVAGLGGRENHPYRDGSYEYYISEPIVTDDPKGIGAFLLTAIEMEKISGQTQGKLTVTLDYYFNNETRKDFQGKVSRFHYIWDEFDDSGFGLLGNIFSDYGVKLAALDKAPNSENLKGTDIYILVDPDGLKDNPNPNYIGAGDIRAIAGWVKNGGVLVIMANDSANCDLVHMNKLANLFGINFSYRSRNMVKGHDFETGAVDISKNNEIFIKAKKAYLKEISILEVSPPAKALISKENDVIMAVSKYGKGIVFAVGDPWLYNEYIDGRKLPAEFQNFLAAKELVKWLIDNKRNR